MPSAPMRGGTAGERLQHAAWFLIGGFLGNLMLLLNYSVEMVDELPADASDPSDGADVSHVTEPTGSVPGEYLELLNALRQSARALDALLNRELSQWHGISADDFWLLLAVYRSPDHTLDRKAVADLLGERLVEVVKRVRPLQRIGLVVEPGEGAEDSRSSSVALTDRGVELVNNAIVTANDVASGALTARWDRELLEGLSRALR